MHDDVYRGLYSKGKISWDGEVDPENMLNHSINLNIKKRINDYFPDLSTKRAVDLGTGTGTCALFLSQLGFSSVGYDISEKAIEMAKQNATTLKLDSLFYCKDIVEIEQTGDNHLVTDSSLLHCLVDEEDRSKFYTVVNNLLSDDGILFIHTMINSDDMSDMLNRTYLFLEGGTLWSTGNESWAMNWHLINGKKVFPHRKILTQEQLESEFQANGFRVIEKEISKVSGNPDTYVGWLKKE